MAILTITEGERLNQTLIDGQLVASMQMPPVREYPNGLAIGGSSTPMADTFQKATRFIRINCDTACCIAVSLPGDPDPVAVAGQHRLGPNETGYYGVTPGGKLAVIATT